MERRLGVAAHDLGGRGPRLLILHANGFHGRSYLPMVPILSTRFRCIALDLPGHGNAPVPDGPFSAEELSGAVIDFVDANNIHGCYAFGHSLGGAMAAMAELERPGTFRAMFLYEPVVRPTQQLSGSDGDRPAEAEAGSSAPSAPPPPPHRGQVAAAASGRPSLSSPGRVLARMARRRQACFPSMETALTSLGSKPPFSSFHPQALSAYLACGGLHPAVVPTAAAAATSGTDPRVITQSSNVCGSGGACSSSSSSSSDLTIITDMDSSKRSSGGLNSNGNSDSSTSSITGGSCWTLACAPESEARVYEALDPPPWRPWHHLGASGRSSGRIGAGGGRRGGSGSGSGSGAAGARGGGSGGGSSGSGPGAGGGARGGAGTGAVPRCRVAVAVAVGDEAAGIHTHLAQWGAQLAELVPGARLFRFPQLQHLGPMEDPTAVASAALSFFLTALEEEKDEEGQMVQGDEGQVVLGGRSSSSGVGSRPERAQARL